MATDVRMCAMPSCKREAASLCYHCERDVCGTHFKEHGASIIVELHSVADRVNRLSTSLSHVSTDRIYAALFGKLKQWRDRSVQQIDDAYQEKARELSLKVRQVMGPFTQSKNDAWQNVNRMKEEINALIDAHEATLNQVARLRNTITNLEFETKKLTSPLIRIETQPVSESIGLLVHFIDQPSDPNRSVDFQTSTSRDHRDFNIENATNVSEAPVHPIKDEPGIHEPHEPEARSTARSGTRLQQCSTRSRSPVKRS